MMGPILIRGIHCWSQALLSLRSPLLSPIVRLPSVHLCFLITLHVVQVRIASIVYDLLQILAERLGLVSPIS